MRLSLSLSAILSCLILATIPATAQDSSEETLTFDVLFGDSPGGAHPEDLSWSPDGKKLGYRWDDGGGDALWLLDATTGEHRKIFDLADMKLFSYRWAPDGESWVLSANGDLHLVYLDDGGHRRLTDTPESEMDPKFSPDGSRLAYAYEYDLHLMDLETFEIRALTDDGERNVTRNGVTDWVYWEELWGRDSTGYWWSPDGKHIAYYRFDLTPEGIYTLINFLPKYPEIEEQRHPKAGTDNPKVQVGILDLADGETTWLETGDPTEYLARVHWRPTDGKVAIHRINRDQTQLDLLLCEPGSGACSTLLTETHPTWLNLGDEFTFLPDGRFLWGSERSGWRHLYLYAADGSLIRPLTSGDRSVTSVDAVHAEAGHVVYTMHGTGTLGTARRQVYRVNLEGGEPEAWTSKPGWHSARVAPKTGHWIHGFSTADQPETLTLRRADGSTVDLPSKPPVYDPDALPRWELFEIEGPDGVLLPARRLLPSGLDASNAEHRRPVIMYHYGCPSSQVVMDRWDGRGRDLWHKMMAQRGYGVLVVDNVTSAFFGKAGEDRGHRRFGALNLEAQKAAVEYLKSLAWVDPDRIGLWGWSGGGSNTLYCLLNAPNTWKAGVSGAPVTDWLLYDTIWTERYLDHPNDNPEGYEKSSAVTYAENLDDALLIVHGTADDNVHPQNTFVMSNALIEAGKPFEMAIYPRQKHGFRGPSSRHFYEKMTTFFERELGE